MDSSASKRAPLRLCVATSNQEKLQEFRRLASRANAAIDSIPQFVDLPVFKEQAPTFAENSLGKALHYSRFTNRLVVADDSGLVVPSLGGAPGVQSARYAGPHATPQQRIDKLLSEMRPFTDEARLARFVCVLTLAQAGVPLAVFSDSVAGSITKQPQGSGGFGYDPVFVPQIGAALDLGASDKPIRLSSFGEMNPEEKDHLSHRGKAFLTLLDFLGNNASNV